MVPCADVRALLLDIEGTTTDVEFVTESLFPYARARARAFLVAHAQDPDVAADLARLEAEHAEDVRIGRKPPPLERSADGAVAYVHWLMDQDRKSTGLKALQGRIWEEGYRAREILGSVYPDVPPALARWRAQGREVAIFSSGSVQAQKAIFRHTVQGDLTPFLSAFFDTTTGPKRERQSYRAIAAALHVRAADMLFLSDVTGELDAARAAGLATALCVRGAWDSSVRTPHPVVTTFDVVCP